jgi:DNA helicase II / ATP-dependent DNA helicase PcrA
LTVPAPRPADVIALPGNRLAVIELLLSRLNPDQCAAARHGLDDSNFFPLLIIAGAGSGKTSTLAHRVGCLIASGVDPRSILLLIFSRRAATEMSRRVEAIIAGLGTIRHSRSLTARSA